MDIVEDMLSRVMDALNIRSGDASSARLHEVEQQIRQEWGGTEPYIPKYRRRDKIREQALQTLAKGMPLKEVVSRTGISRAQVYRLLKLKK